MVRIIPSKCAYVLIVVFIIVLGAEALINFSDMQCGQRTTAKRMPKIVGGVDATKYEFPWLVSITRRGGHFCGGSVINNKYILTAGHCLCTGIGVDILKPSNIKITLAQHDLSEKMSDTFEKTIESIIVHPGYTCNKPKDDIAILELKEELEWSDTVSPACLPLESDQGNEENIRNILATVAGWGWTNEDTSKGARAKILQKAEVNIIETRKCREWYKLQGKKTKIQETQICAGHEQGRIDACWADSGGPLMVQTGNADQLMVVGVVSTGIGCARPYLPGLYTRVARYIPWIKDVVNL